MNTKTISMGIVGLGVGIGAMAGVASLEAKEVITVEDSPTKDKKELVISVEAPATATYTISQLEMEVEAYNGRINQLNRDLAEVTAKRDERKALLDRVSAEVNKK
jgi:TolA-binding protein